MHALWDYKTFFFWKTKFCSLQWWRKTFKMNISHCVHITFLLTESKNVCQNKVDRYLCQLANLSFDSDTRDYTQSFSVLLFAFEHNTKFANLINQTISKYHVCTKLWPKCVKYFLLQKYFHFANFCNSNVDRSKCSECRRAFFWVFRMKMLKIPMNQQISCFLYEICLFCVLLLYQSRYSEW